MSAKADCLVLFGATGDLAYKKLYPALHALQQRGKLDIPVVGIAREGWTLAKLRDRIRASLTASGVPDGDEAANALLQCIKYVHGDYNDPTSFTLLAEAMENVRMPVFYLAIPPALFGEVVAGLAHHDLTATARVVVEKPLGRDLQSAEELNRALAAELHEDQIFRIDHFLGYEQVQNILVARFGNTILEPIWNRRYVRRVHIEMSESFGVDGRGSFYETVGCLRDVVQNHLLQLLWERLHPAGSAPLGLADYRTAWLEVRPPAFRPRGGRARNDGIAPTRAILADALDLAAWPLPQRSGDLAALDEAAAIDAVAGAFAAHRCLHAPGDRWVRIGTAERGQVVMPADPDLIARAEVNIARLRDEGTINIPLAVAGRAVGPPQSW